MMVKSATIDVLSGDEKWVLWDKCQEVTYTAVEKKLPADSEDQPLLESLNLWNSDYSYTHVDFSPHYGETDEDRCWKVRVIRWIAPRWDDPAQVASYQLVTNGPCYLLADDGKTVERIN